MTGTKPQIKRTKVNVETAVEEMNEQPKEFHIDSDRAAEWFLRSLANLEAETERIQQQADKLIANLNRRRAYLQERYGFEFEAFCKQKLEQSNSKSKTLHFLQGSASFRTVPASVKVADLHTALVYAKCADPALIETVEKLDAQAYKKRAEAALSETGELLPGIDLTEPAERFYIKFPKTSDQANDQTDE